MAKKWTQFFNSNSMPMKSRGLRTMQRKPSVGKKMWKANSTVCPNGRPHLILKSNQALVSKLMISEVGTVMGSNSRLQS